MSKNLKTDLEELLLAIQEVTLSYKDKVTISHKEEQRLIMKQIVLGIKFTKEHNHLISIMIDDLKIIYFSTLSFLSYFCYKLA